jgi:hypothetical protein
VDQEDKVGKLVRPVVSPGVRPGVSPGVSSSHRPDKFGVQRAPKLLVSIKTHYVNSQKQWINKNKDKLDFHTWELVDPLDDGDFLALSEFLPENKETFEMFKCSNIEWGMWSELA